MRKPDELTPDELASLNQLWAIYPDEILMRHDRDHSRLDGLVSDGYIERTEYEHGIGYRISAERAVGLASVVDWIAEGASRN
jgi:hypothetical protein